MNIKNTDIYSLRLLSEPEMIRYELSQTDGRIKIMQKHIDNTYSAIFNREPFKYIDITKEQFERYKPFLTLQTEYHLDGIVEYYSNIFDTGVPRWFDWLCGR